VPVDPPVLAVLAELIVCPVCHASLDGVTCAGCSNVYAIDDGVPNLTPIPPPEERVRARWALWEELQANGTEAYEIDPPSSLSVGRRPDAEAFATFCDLRGLVLDIGCGVQGLPTYGSGLGAAFVGIDPLRGEPNREFAFVQAIAEFLPFRDETFDRVLFATSIDHVLVPELAVAEATRVTRPGGWVCVWLGEVPAPGLVERVRRRTRLSRRVRVRTPRAEMTFRVPAGAVDPFHVSHPDAATVAGWLEGAGLAVHAIERPLPGHCFVRAGRKG
jgi:SAM-dependent methyltransferase